VDRPDLKKLDESNLREFKGEYYNVAIDTSDQSYIPKFISLWSVANSYEKISINQTNWKKQTVKISFAGTDKMCFQLYDEGRFISQKIITGSIKDGYFYESLHGFIVPFIPLWFGYDFERRRIGFKGDQLIIDISESYWMAALIAGNSYKKQRVLGYKKIEN
jgi:hypothetical protein